LHTRFAQIPILPPPLKKKYKDCKCVPKPKKELTPEQEAEKEKQAEMRRQDAQRKKDEMLRLEQENTDLRQMLKKVLCEEESE
jgi:hypothetical protein